MTNKNVVAKKWTASGIKSAKGKHKLACLTAYDYSMARLVDEGGIQMILVGDSLGMTMLGYENTLPVTMQEMLHHTAAVSRGVKNALVVADMPFMSYQVSTEQALENAGHFLKSSGAGAVKIEGGQERYETVKALVENGIPVLGHIGLTPQSIKKTGYKVKGRTDQAASMLIDDAKALSAAGVFALVLECIPAELAAGITNAVPVPTIGIGAGNACDGQMLVLHDILGIYDQISPKFVKRYADVGSVVKDAISNYKKEVENGSFPDDDHSY